MISFTNSLDYFQCFNNSNAYNNFSDNFKTIFHLFKAIVNSISILWSEPQVFVKQL